MAKALITGITGQDGAYLAQWLLHHGYEVIGVMRRSASSDVVAERLRWLGIISDVCLVEANLIDLSSLVRTMQDHHPDEVYNLGAQSFVAASWQQPLLTGAVTGLGAANMLEAVRIGHPSARFYQASSSEMFGKTLWTEPERTDTISSQVAIRDREIIRPLDDHQLPREFRLVCVIGHSVQPRESVAWYRIRHPQGH